MAQAMIFEEAAAPPFMKNGFVLGCPRTKEGIVIDPGDEVDDLIKAATTHRLHIVGILLTHAHLDHVTGVAAAKRAFGAPVHLHRADQFLYDAAPQQGAMFGLRVEQPPPVDRHYAEGASLSFGDFRVDVHHTPGHCPGGVCLAVESSNPESAMPSRQRQELFVGDTLFAGSIGRTDLPGGDYDTLIRSIREVLFRFPDATPVYSGHGPATTVGQEKRTNPFLTGDR
jgi:glyoxylase-like metal-dependent hydrolase (beta-lactamase superfamily II)